MSRKARGRSARTIPDRFTIQLYTDDGRFLREFILDSQRDNVTTLRAAERIVRDNLSDHYRRPVIIVLSQETLTKLRQVQIRVGANNAESPRTAHFMSQQPASVDDDEMRGSAGGQAMPH